MNRLSASREEFYISIIPPLVKTLIPDPSPIHGKGEGILN
jgi:hypothetical protein